MLRQSARECGAGDYTLQMPISFRYALDIGRFAKSWTQVFERHDALRMEFPDPETARVSDCTLPFIFEDWRSLSAASQSTAKARVLAACPHEKNLKYIDHIF